MMPSLAPKLSLCFMLPCRQHDVVCSADCRFALILKAALSRPNSWQMRQERVLGRNTPSAGAKLAFRLGITRLSIMRGGRVH